MADELKPCPFDHKEDFEEFGFDNSDYPPDLRNITSGPDAGAFEITCSYCGASGGCWPTREEAIVRWNRRPEPEKPKGQLEIVFVNSVPDGGYPIRILEAYLEQAKHRAIDSPWYGPPIPLLMLQYNSDQEVRAEVLRDAIAKLKSIAKPPEPIPTTTTTRSNNISDLVKQPKTVCVWTWGGEYAPGCGEYAVGMAYVCQKQPKYCPCCGRKVEVDENNRQDRLGNIVYR